METYNITGVEIFSEGEWNGDEYSKEDLNEMVKAFNETKDGIRPFIKLGHDEKQKLIQSDGLPAAGWIERIYTRGDKLLADFSDIPKKIFELIQTKAYRKVSSEIFWNLKIKGKKYSRVLGAVALLGADTPGVFNLSDILANYYKDKSNPPKRYPDLEIDFNLESELTKTISGKEYKMQKTENEIKLELELKNKNEESKKSDEALKKFSSDIELKDKEIERLKKIEADFQKREQELALETEKARVAKFVAELEKEKLSTPAMKELITQLVGPEKKEYSVKVQDKDQTLSKEQLLKETLKLFKAASEVNFEESSEDGEKKSYKADDKELDEKAKKFAADNKVSYGQALKHVMKESKK